MAESGAGWRRSLRGVAVLAIALVAAALLWRLRPAAGLAAAPDADIVAGCGWLAWGLASYLSLAVAGAAIAALSRRRGLARFAPATVRRLVDTAVSVGLVAAVLAPTAAVAAPARHGSVATASVQPRAPALDWPGLTIAVAPVDSPLRSSGGAAAANHGGAVVVRPGDTLWSIAAAQLGPGTSRNLIAASWPQWYAANRHVIGPDPGVIHPGQRLHPPPTHPSP